MSRTFINVLWIIEGWERVGSSANTHIDQTSCTVHWKSVHHHPHTHRVLLCYRFSFPLYLALSLSSFLLPSAGCGESFANWFWRGNIFTCLFPPRHPKALSLLDDSLVSRSCQLSRAFTQACYSCVQRGGLGSFGGFRKTSLHLDSKMQGTTVDVNQDFNPFLTLKTLSDVCKITGIRVEKRKKCLDLNNLEKISTRFPN